MHISLGADTTSYVVGCVHTYTYNHFTQWHHRHSCLTQQYPSCFINIPSLPRSMCHAVVSILIASFAAGTALAALDTAALGEQYFGNDAAWYRDKIPFFEISDSDIQDVYYYRWKIFRAHQRDLGERGYVSTGQYTHTCPP